MPRERTSRQLGLYAYYLKVKLKYYKIIHYFMDNFPFQRRPSKQDYTGNVVTKTLVALLASDPCAPRLKRMAKEPRQP